MNNHKADIKNANKGTDGVNSTYAKAQGNKGKLINPNQKSSLIIVFDREQEILVGYNKKENSEIELIKKDFAAEFINKGFAEEVGARLINNEELKHRGILSYCAAQCQDDDENRFIYFNNFYICIEFLKDKDTPWTLEEANQLLKDRISPKVGFREFFYIDEKCIENYVGQRMSAQFEAYMEDDLSPVNYDCSPADHNYCPAIDGY